MVDFLIFCMATVGLTAILVDGKIFAPFRERLESRVHAQEERQQANIVRGGKKRRTWSGFLLDILTCYQCCGFWSGLFCGLFLTMSRFGGMAFCISLPVNLPHMPILVPIYFLLILLMCGLAGSFLATVYLMIVELVFAKTMLCRRTNPEPPLDDAFHEEHGHE
ncbi:MAG: DUF1360 domain-containing protein [Planctomycetaceae bacterium]|nr:DUF1360 domain-containing protein [Planctomycetaceae bacterium]